MVAQEHQWQQRRGWAERVQDGAGACLAGIQANLQHLAQGLLQQDKPFHQRYQQQQQQPFTRSSGGPFQLSLPLPLHRRGSGGSSSSSNGDVSQRRATITGIMANSAISAARDSALHKPVSREELGRCTWTLLHTLAAQFPEHPTRQEQRDARALIDTLTRIYPCGDCAKHFKELVRQDPPEVSHGQAFQQWMCRAHNTVNRSLGKPAFNCNLAAARWLPLDCDEAASCALSVGNSGKHIRRW